MSGTEVTNVETPTLKAADRCDRCGAQASVKTIHDELALLWCAHHFREHEIRLASHVVVDERATLT